MEAQLVFSILALDIWDLFPVKLIPVVLVLALFPILVLPFFRKQRTEASGRTAAQVAIAVLAIGGTAHFYMTKTTFEAQQDTLKSGQVETVSGTYDGAVVTNLFVLDLITGIRVSGRLLEAPGGLYGPWSDAVLPRGLAVGDDIHVAVTTDIYLQVLKQ